MEHLEIKGGHALKGNVRISGAKNAALPMLAATLLAQGMFVLQDVPSLEDVNTFIRLLEELGFTIEKDRDGQLRVDSSGLSSHAAPYELVRMMRASVLVLGPLVAMLGKARVALPGGCAIGARPIDFHLKGLELMGAKLKLKEGFVEAKARYLTGARIYFDIPSVTATENLMMAATLARGKTVLENAAREPEVVALGEMLLEMGAIIRGLGTETVVIEGVKELSPVSWKIIPDRIEAGTYLMAVGAAGGHLIIENMVPHHLDAVIGKLRD
ncbi:MAG: UDP-N-acetylglucosamine 1-carboxyvinyltransferase, partial [Thermodesulfatator sp.]